MTDIWTRWGELLGSAEADPLEVIALAGTYHRYLAAVEASAVTAARAGGATWQDIADAAGTSRQSAWEKWRAAQRLAAGSEDAFRRDFFEAERAALAEEMTRLSHRRYGRAGPDEPDAG